jgi:hypothetical protein
MKITHLLLAIAISVSWQSAIAATAAVDGKVSEVKVVLNK